MIKISFLNKSNRFEALNSIEMQLTKGGDSQPQKNNEAIEHSGDIDDNDQPILL